MGKFKSIVCLLVILVMIMLSILSCNTEGNIVKSNASKSTNVKEIEKVEFFYVPNNTRMETSMDVEFLKDTTHRWISYACISDLNILEEIGGFLNEENFIKTRIEGKREPFFLIRVTHKKSGSFEFTKERLRFFSFNGRNYFNVELEKWMRENLPKTDSKNKKRIYCR